MNDAQGRRQKVRGEAKPSPARRRSASRLSASALCLLACSLLVHAPALRAETLSLDDCLREVLAGNPDIARARTEVERAQGTRLSLRARSLPQLGIAGIAGQQGQQSDLETLGPDRDAQGDLVRRTAERPGRFFTLGSGTFSQPLFDFAVPALYRRGNLEVAVARHNLAAAAVTALHAARLQFHVALFARENEAISREILRRLGENERGQRDLLAAGLAARVSLLQAQLQRLSLAPRLPIFAGSRRTALITLLGLMGRDLGPRPRAGGRPDGVDPLENVELRGTLEDLNGPRELSFDLAAASALALERRPDLASLRAVLASVGEDVRTLRAGRYPLIRFVATGTLIPQNEVRTTEQSIRESDNVRTTELRYGADFTWTVLDFGAVSGPVAAFRASGEAVAARLRQGEEAVPRALADVRATLRDVGRRRTALNGGREAAEATLNAVQAAAVQGASTQYELLLAQSDLFTNRNGRLQAAFEEANARAEFDRVTGGYLRYVEAPSGGKAGGGRGAGGR